MEIIARGQITIWNYKDGDDAYSVILNHDTHAVACDPSGNALVGELGPSGKAVFALSAYKGATKLTMRYAGAASAAGICTWKFGTISGCSAAQISGSNEKFYISTMTADSAYVEVVCSVDGKASVTRRVTIVRQKKGDAGAPGRQGRAIRPRGIWTARTLYMYNEEYRDVVIYNNSVYIVKATHTSAVSFDSSQWEPFNEFINVATSVLLANKGYIDVLGAARLFVGDTNKSTGWEMTNGYIRHTGSGLTLTSDGRLHDPDGLHLSVGGKTVQDIVAGAVDTTKEEVRTGISVGNNMIRVLGRDISLSGSITFTSLAPDAQGRINTAQNAASAAQRTADRAITEKIELSRLGSTVIEGGYIKTDLIRTSELFTRNITATSFNLAGGMIGGFKVSQTHIGDANDRLSLTPDGILFRSVTKRVGIGNVIPASSGNSHLVGGMISVTLGRYDMHGNSGAFMVTTTGGSANTLGASRQCGISVITDNGKHDVALRFKGRVVTSDGRQGYNGIFGWMTPWDYKELQIVDGIVVNVLTKPKP